MSEVTGKIAKMPLSASITDHRSAFSINPKIWHTRLVRFRLSEKKTSFRSKPEKWETRGVLDVTVAIANSKTNIISQGTRLCTEPFVLIHATSVTKLSHVEIT